MSRFILSGCVLCWILGCNRSRPELHVYTWADYIKPELVERFEKEHGCKIVIDTFDSNEAMYAKIKAGALGYDIITPSSYMVELMSRQGLLLRLDHELLPNITYIDEKYLQLTMDKEMQYSVPYMLSNTGLAYLKSKVPDFEASWASLGRADLKGRVTMLNDMRESIGAALKFLGYSLNTRNPEELKEAEKVLTLWKKNLAKFENEQYKIGLANGEFLLVHGYSGDLLQAQAENEDVVFVVPREGTSLSSDDLVIPKTAQEVRLAHAFINFLADPKVAAENSNFISYVAPNKGAYPMLDPALKKNPAVFLPDELKAKCEVIRDLGEDNAKYTAVWDAVKAAK